VKGFDSFKAIADDIIRIIDYPWYLGEPDDTHIWNAFHGNQRWCRRIDADFWQKASETLTVRVGDCIEENTEILMADYRRKKIREVQVGDWVLTYDFKRQHFTQRRVIRKWDKGVKDVYRVFLRNGAWFDATLDHRIFSWRRNFWNVKDYSKELVERRLSDPFLRKQHEGNYILVVRLLPPLGDFSPSLSEAEAFLVGNYLAEGWSEGSHTCSSGINQTMLDYLEEARIPFSFRERGTSSYVTYLKSPFKNFLRNFGSNAFDKRMGYLLHLPRNQLEILLRGFEGDAYREKRKKVRVKDRLVNTNKKLTYATSSDELAKDLIIAHWILGRPLNVWLQMEHKGLGKKPIWRLTENTNSHFNKETLPYLSKVSIKGFQYLGKRRVYDIEVDETHNFVLAFSGVIVHNCEDSSIAFVTAVRAKGLSAGNVYEAFGVVRDANTKALLGGHGWAISKGIPDDKWRLYESTLDTPPAEYPIVKNPEKPFKLGNIEYAPEWLFNDKIFKVVGSLDYREREKKKKETPKKYEAIHKAFGIETKFEKVLKKSKLYKIKKLLRITKT